MDMVDWCYRQYGIARILPYNPKLGAGYYLCKYLTKELADVEFSATFSDPPVSHLDSLKPPFTG